MSWLLALIARPFGAVLLFALAAFLAFFVVRPLIPEGRLKNSLFDRSIRKRHPWRFAVLALVACYGTIAGVAYFVS